MNSIHVGSGTNIQDNSLVHVAKSNLSGKVLPTIIGDNVTIGKYAVFIANSFMLISQYIYFLHNIISLSKIQFPTY